LRIPQEKIISRGKISERKTFNRAELNFDVGGRNWMLRHVEGKVRVHIMHIHADPDQHGYAFILVCWIRLRIQEGKIYL
jgi:hypothetical protein